MHHKLCTESTIWIRLYFYLPFIPILICPCGLWRLYFAYVKSVTLFFILELFCLISFLTSGSVFSLLLFLKLLSFSITLIFISYIPLSFPEVELRLSNLCCWSLSSFYFPWGNKACSTSNRSNPDEFQPCVSTLTDYWFSKLLSAVVVTQLCLCGENTSCVRIVGCVWSWCVLIRIFGSLFADFCEKTDYVRDFGDALAFHKWL